MDREAVRTGLDFKPGAGKDVVHIMIEEDFSDMFTHQLNIISVVII